MNYQERLYLKYNQIKENSNTCLICYGKYKKYNKSKHEKTSKHLNALKKKNKKII